MTELYVPDLTVFTNIFTNMKLLGSSGIVALIMGFLGMAVITRDVEKWKLLWMPMMLVVWTMGIPLGGLGSLALLFSAILFVIEILSTGVIGNIIHGVSEGTKTGTSRMTKIIGGLTGGINSTTKRGREKIKEWEGVVKDGKYIKQPKRIGSSEGIFSKIRRERNEKLSQKQEDENRRALAMIRSGNNYEDVMRKQKVENISSFFKRQDEKTREKIARMQEKFYKNAIARNRQYKSIKEVIEEQRRLK